MNNEITKKNRYTKLLNDAIDAFQKETGRIIEKLDIQLINDEPFTDAVVRIGDANDVDYRVELKMNLNEMTVGGIANYLEGEPFNHLIVTRFVPPQIAKKMKERNVQFIDTAGNAYINQPPMLIYIHGNRTTHKEQLDVEQDIFGVAGVRILFVMLCQPELQDAPYRDIARAAGVALGTVAGLMKNLQQQGFVMDIEGKRKTLLRKKELFEKWVHAYAVKLRPKQLIGRYTTQREQLWQHYDIREENAMWGGEVAANKMTNYLKPEIVTIYARKPIDNLMVNLRLRRDEKGIVEIREQFWEFPITTIKKELVPELLIYADLLATGDNRNIVTAKIIYNEHLKRYFE
ncbi:MAG: type IV toxin-antitoxin system AbiEi family antitoxin [Bacteroidota bacterium]|nr:type IV toxin-antitoxin system AbiEi family antitoxin [Bacteroidota bacterium]